VRIAQVVTSYYPRIGGVETHVRHLAEGLARAGDCVTVLTHQVPGSPVDDWMDSVRVRRFSLTVRLSNYPFSASFFRYLKSHVADFDLVHVHNYHTVLGHAAIGKEVPIVYTPHYHGTGHTPFRALLHRMYRPIGAKLFNASDAIVSVSEAERKHLIMDFPQAAEKAVMIPNGIGRPRAVAGEEGSPDGGPIVITVGRLERYKNIDLIIDAFQALPTPARLVVVGDGPERANLERRASAHTRGWPIVFTGWISDQALESLFRQATVVSSASDHEAFGLSLAEGLASGARVVASAIPAHTALSRLVGVDGPIALAEPRNTQMFTSLLAAGLGEGRIQTGDLNLPSWDYVVDRTREVYSRVCFKHAQYARGPLNMSQSRLGHPMLNRRSRSKFDGNNL
jgi:glycosyltransferase involved in cell wall biosynthesis